MINKPEASKVSKLKFKKGGLSVVELLGCRYSSMYAMSSSREVIEKHRK